MGIISNSLLLNNIICSLDVDYKDDIVNLIMCDFTISKVTKLFHGFVLPHRFGEVSEFYVYQDESGTSISETTQIDRDGSKEVEGTNYDDNCDQRKDYHDINLECNDAGNPSRLQSDSKRNCCSDAADLVTNNQQGVEDTDVQRSACDALLPRSQLAKYPTTRADVMRHQSCMLL